MKTVIKCMWQNYLSLNINERINAKSQRNALNINYIMGATIESLRIGSNLISDRPAIYSRSCNNWKLYHK